MEQTKKKILIVDDDKDFQWILKQSFITSGFSVVTALDGLEGLAAAKKENPDIILLDILMPKIDGISMAKRLQELKNPALIVFLTNAKDEAHISRAIEAVPNTEYILKSDLSVSEVVNRIKAKLNVK